MLGSNEGSFGDELEKEIGMLLREQRRQDADDRERELNIYRSGSAPPTVEGSLSAVGGFFGGAAGAPATGAPVAFLEFQGTKDVNGITSEEEVRSDPAYLSYYYSNVNLNPRLPPPLLSKEDWRFQQRLKGGASALGGIGDRRKVNRTDDNGGRFLDFGDKFGVGDTIVCCVDLESKPLASIGFSKTGKLLGAATQFDVARLGVADSSPGNLQWTSALFPHVLLKNVVVQMQFSVEDGLVP